PPAEHGDRRAIQGWRSAPHRRAIRRGEGVPRWHHHHRCAGPRCRARLGGKDRACDDPPDRGPALQRREALIDIERVFREEHGRAVAVLVGLFGDIDVAEESVQDAFLAAVERWPSTGVPASPAGWIITTARNRAIDRLRRESTRDDRHAQAALLHAGDETIEELDEESVVRDDRLRLIFTCCHPALAPAVRVALTLRLLGGLTTVEIARAFLVPEATIAQRIVRAKKTLADKHVPFEVPRGDELASRLESVLEVVYLIFNEGYSATAGDDWMR